MLFKRSKRSNDRAYAGFGCSKRITEFVKMLLHHLIPRHIPDREELESMGKAEAPGYSGMWREAAYGRQESPQFVKKHKRH